MHSRRQLIQIIKHVILFLAFLSTPVVAGIVQGMSNSMAVFQLAHDKPCNAKISLIVEGLNKDAKSIGLTEDAITATVRSRLRGARIYDESAGPFFYVNVTASGPAYGLTVKLNKIYFMGIYIQ